MTAARRSSWRDSIEWLDAAGFLDGRRFGVVVTLSVLLGHALLSAPAMAQTLVSTLAFDAYDAAFDDSRGVVYLTDRDGQQIVGVDLTTGTVVQQFDSAYFPEHLALTPDGERLYIALPARDHSYYWWEEDQYGYIGSIDLSSGVLDRQFEIALDPFDLVATDADHVIVGSGSGQWTDLRSYEGGTGAPIGGSVRIRQGTRLYLHPSQEIIYGADNGLSPSDIERYDVAPDGTLTGRGDSPYHGTHRMWGNLWVAPDGEFLVTRGGDVFTAGRTVISEDMNYVESLTPSSVEAVAFDHERRVIFTGRDTTVSWYNLESFAFIGEVTVPGDVEHIFVDGLSVYVVSVVANQTRIVRFDHPTPNGDTNTHPQAAVEVTPATGATTQTTIVFDASDSEDAESGLIYRWDLEDDGEWDTEFGVDPVLEHRFSIAGTKFVRLQVQDDLGLVDETLVQVDVAFEADPGDPGGSNLSFLLPFDVFDVVFDPNRPYAYVTSREEQRLYFVNLDTGFIERSFGFDEFPEFMALTPDGDRLYVSLPVQLHSSYWWEEDQYGFIASFDLTRGVKDRQFEVNLDPYDLVATASGHVVVGSGSGQWTDLRSYDGETGAPVGGPVGIRQRTRLDLHPSQGIIYGADNGLSPSDIERYDVATDGTLTGRGDSPYHGTHRMGGNLWVAPNGEYLVTRGGDVFTAGRDVITEDMNYLQGLTPSYVEVLTFDPERRAVFTGRQETITWYNLESLSFVGETTIEGDARFIGVRGLQVFAVADVEGGARIVRLDHPMPSGGTNTNPRAAVEVTPATGATTQTTIVFDASGSEDAESGLVYRWDLEDDGEWDTDLSTDPVLEHRFSIAGTKFVRLQVQDDLGLVDETLVQVDVAFEADPGEPGGGNERFLLPFDVFDVVFDPKRPYVYVTSREEQRLYFVNLDTGFIERSFGFDEFPEFMTITPDGDRLFVSLPVQNHSSYWWEEDQYGFIASFDLTRGVKDRQFEVNLDPYDLVATASGHVIVGSGSGQWTDLRSYDGETGAPVGGPIGIRQGTRLDLHPSQGIIYGADNGLSPSDIERYDVAPDGALTGRGDSPYHGAHRMSGNVWVAPNGEYLVTRGGDVFTAGRDVITEDMNYLQGLTPSYINALTFDPARRTIFTARGHTLSWFNVESRLPVGETAIEGDARFIGVRGLQVFAVSDVDGGAQIVRLDHPMPDGATNTHPEVAVEVTPATGATTQTTIVFDASGSRDAEGALLYRWDLDDDGEWDTEFVEDPRLEHRFPIAGTKFVRLQVRDELGLVAETHVRLDVTFEPDPGEPGEAHPRFALPFTPADLVFDPNRPLAYATSKVERKLYVIDLETGFIQRTYSFAWMPERMTFTPDGDRLFVTLLTREHSSYWWEEDQEGYIASFDLVTGVKDRQFRIALDPYDLVATSNDRLVVTSGSGQWTYIMSFDATNGAQTGSLWSIRERSTLDLHPSGSSVYTSGGTSYPQDIRRYDLDPQGGITYRWDSIYHGQHRVGSGIWITPDGGHAISGGGDVFSIGGNSRQTDIRYAASAASDSGGYLDVLYTPDRNEAVAVSRYSIEVLDTTTWTSIYRESFDHNYPAYRLNTGFVGRRGPLLYSALVFPESDETLIHVHSYDNTAPVAAALPDVVGECGAPIRLDAAASYDPDDIDGMLVDIVDYRWILESPDAGPTLLGEDVVLEPDLPLGTHTLALEVVDHAGAIGRSEFELEIRDTLAPQLTPVAEPAFLDPSGKYTPVEVQIEAWDQCSDEVSVLLTDAISNRPIVGTGYWKVLWQQMNLSGIREAAIGTDDRSFLLQGKNNWDGSGRVYTLEYSATDAEGNVGDAKVEIPVTREMPKPPKANHMYK